MIQVKCMNLILIKICYAVIYINKEEMFSLLITSNYFRKEIEVVIDE
ncbi:hypothetical protein bsdtb5_39930 [Anaeromicropila herbilytica]|uniref:Uncharacterized protein n=1 Tax=Anaeromicropila herbilytica TaxID=2785025 RepID=A0A7R7EPM2_9FIRM|nr:hypothetical protein bsdtb5_39930 [Anaeromicropila herbilytica]